MSDNDVIFVRYVPPPYDEEITVIPFIPLEYFETPICPNRPPSPMTPVWLDQWEDLDDDSSGDYKE